jgi:hypothetical protein
MTGMTAPDFDQAVRRYQDRYPASLISGRRTPAHSIAAGGFAGDPHSGRNFLGEHGFGADVEYDPGQVPLLEEAEAAALELGLRLLREHHRNGDHLQPSDWMNDPPPPPAGAVDP